MSIRKIAFVWLLIVPALFAQSYFPPSGNWQHKAPAEVGMDAAKLKEAIDWAKAHGSKWDFDKDQVRVFGTPVGALPPGRAETNGLILRHGYIVGEFGDTKTNDPVYSVAKSFLSTTAGTIRHITQRLPGRIICSRNRSGKGCSGRRTPTSLDMTRLATVR
jgi:hypothetical protein